MQNEKDLTPALVEIQDALGQLQPASPGIDRDRLIFYAGRNSSRRSSRSWQALSVLLILMLSVSIFYRTEPEIIDNIEYVYHEPYTSSGEAFKTSNYSTYKWERDRSAANYIILRNRVITQGPEALNSPPLNSTISEPPPTREQLLQELLSS